MSVFLIVVQIVFWIMAFGLLYGGITSKHPGVIIGGVIYGGAALGSFVLWAWWPLAVGFILALIAAKMGGDPSKNSN